MEAVFDELQLFRRVNPTRVQFLVCSDPPINMQVSPYYVLGGGYLAEP